MNISLTGDGSEKHGPQNELTPELEGAIRHRWARGFDTRQMALYLHKPEAVVEREVNRMLDEKFYSRQPGHRAI